MQEIQHKSEKVDVRSDPLRPKSSLILYVTSITYFYLNVKHYFNNVTTYQYYEIYLSYILNYRNLNLVIAILFPLLDIFHNCENLIVESTFIKS